MKLAPSAQQMVALFSHNPQSASTLGQRGAHRAHYFRGAVPAAQRDLGFAVA